jgi:ATP-dependent Clp protease ATP-binding subunit ClpA
MGPGGPEIPWPPQSDRFTDEAKRALAFAQDEAAGLNHNHVGPVHLLVGLVREGEGGAARTFAELGLTHDRARTALASIMGQGEAPIAASDITLTPRAQRVMEMAGHESRRLGHPRTGTEHLLLAIAHEGEAFSSRLLESVGVDPKAVPARVLQELHVPASYRAAENATVSQGPYDNFDDASRQTLAFAHEEAVRMGHNLVGGEHLVVGLARVNELSTSDDALPRAFGELNLTLERVRAAVAKIQPSRDVQAASGEVKFNAITKMIIEHAMSEAGPGKTVRPRHILLALGRAQDGVSGHVLAQLGATPERLRAILEAPEDKDHGTVR